MFCSRCRAELADDSRSCSACGAPVAPAVPATSTIGATDASRKRPAWVWVIFCFYLLSAGFTLLSFFLIFSGRIRVTEAQRTYFANLSALDFLATVGLAVLVLIAATSLFFLHRVAVRLFAIVLACNVGFTILHLLSSNFVEASGGRGVTGMIGAWIVLVAILLYAMRLSKRGILT